MLFSIKRWVYIAVCVLAAIVPTALDLLGALNVLESKDFTTSSMAHAFFGIILLAILTFPAGAIGVAAWWFLFIWPGLSIFTPAENIGLLAPVFAFLGYFQWYVWIPSYFDARIRKSTKPV